METPILHADRISKIFYEAERFQVLTDISFSVDRGSFVSIVGKSGCGKSTLLYILSTMDTDYTGQLYLDGGLLTGRSGAELAQVRNEKIGFVFQFHYLIEEFNVLTNVMLPALKLNRLTREEITERATERLNILGIADQALKHPSKLSGGQKQRVAIARALINDPLIIMGDEPTGNLDQKNSEVVFELFQKVCEEKNQTILVVTHDPDFARRTSRIIEMEDGRIRKR